MKSEKELIIESVHQIIEDKVVEIVSSCLKGDGDIEFCESIEILNILQELSEKLDTLYYEDVKELVKRYEAQKTEIDDVDDKHCEFLAELSCIWSEHPELSWSDIVRLGVNADIDEEQFLDNLYFNLK